MTVTMRALHPRRRIMLAEKRPTVETPARALIDQAVAMARELRDERDRLRRRLAQVEAELDSLAVTLTEPRQIAIET